MKKYQLSVLVSLVCLLTSCTYQESNTTQTTTTTNLPNEPIEIDYEYLCDYPSRPFKMKDIFPTTINSVVLNGIENISLKSEDILSEFLSNYGDMDVYEVEKDSLNTAFDSTLVYIFGDDASISVEDYSSYLFFKRSFYNHYCNDEKNKPKETIFTFLSPEEQETHKLNDFVFDYYNSIINKHKPENLNFGVSHELHIMKYEDDDIMIYCDPNINLGFADYEWLKEYLHDFDYKSYGLLLYEDDILLNTYPTSIGEHILIFKGKDISYFLRYRV